MQHSRSLICLRAEELAVRCREDRWTVGSSISIVVAESSSEVQYAEEVTHAGPSTVHFP